MTSACLFVPLFVPLCVPLITSDFLPHQVSNFIPEGVSMTSDDL